MTKRLRGDRNQCPTCSEYFNSTKAFDRHRTGRFGVDRRCRTVAEMVAVGMVKNPDGFWVTEPWPEASGIGVPADIFRREGVSSQPARKRAVRAYPGSEVAS